MTKRAARAKPIAAVLGVNKAPGRLPAPPLIAPLVACQERGLRHVESRVKQDESVGVGRFRWRRGAQRRAWRAQHASIIWLAGTVWPERTQFAAGVSQRKLAARTAEQSRL